MAITATEIANEALKLMDETVVQFPEASTTEVSLFQLALIELPQVARKLIKDLPYELKSYLAKDASSLTSDPLTGGEDQSAYEKQKIAVIAPSDFWELVSTRLTVWAKSVTSYILIDGSEYHVQNNPFTRGGVQNPVVAIANESVGSDRRIEFFSINDGDASTIENFQYVSFDNVPDDVGNTWADELFDHVTKALVSDLLTLKSRIEEGALREQEVMKLLAQHL